MTEEQKRKISLSIETRRKISLANKGKKHPPLSEEHKQKLRGRIPWNKEIAMSEEQKSKMSLRFKGMRLNTGRTHIKKGQRLSPKTEFQKGSKHTEEWKKNAREWMLAHPNKHFKETSIELKIENELKKLGIDYQKHISLCNIANVDFYIPEQKIVIQADGCYWHNCPVHKPNGNIFRKEKDIRQDKVLIENGLKVFRFWEHEINKSAKECVDKIELGGNCL